MKHLFFLILIVSCSQLKTKPPEDDLITVHAALNQAQASYLLGCVEAFKELKMTVAFPTCRDKSLIHRRELDLIME